MSVFPSPCRRIANSAAPPPLSHREKVRSLHDAIQKLDKYKNIVIRKRQRSADSGADKLASSSGALRIGAQNSSAVMSKRVRSSLADARVRHSSLSGSLSVSAQSYAVLGLLQFALPLTQS